MKRFKVRYLILTITLILGIAVFALRPEPFNPSYSGRIGPFFDQDIDLSERYRSITKESLFISLPDGTKLAADIFLPSDPVDAATVDEQGEFPTILEYTPYNRAVVQPDMRWWDRIYLWWSLGITEPVYDGALRDSVRQFVSRGYAYAFVDMRGTGASFGSQAPLMPQLGEDGAEVVQWIASQGWSNERVGMRGQSYVGWSQFATANAGPDALKCIAPSAIIFDSYSEGMRPGGITATRWLDVYSNYLQSFNLNRFDIDEYFYPSAPVVDEDGDGWLLDEVPLAGQGDATVFLDDGAPQYEDGQQRTDNTYYLATSEHEDNVLVERFKKDDVRFADAQIEFEGSRFDFQDTSPGAMLNSIIDRQLPVFHEGGWFDGFSKGTTKLHATLQGRSPTNMMIGPRFHVPVGLTASYEEFFGYEGHLAYETALQQARFFDWCLRGEDNGFEQEPPVTIYVMNKGWRAEPEWPIARREPTSYYIGENQELADTIAESGEDAFDVDFEHQSNYGSNGINRWILVDAPDAVMTRTEVDSQTLVYETPPLSQGIEVTGHPLVHLWLSANQDDADVFVYLTDVDPDGNAYYVSEGQLRASFHKLVDPGTQSGGALEVQPELPWHGYRSVDQDNAALADGKVVELEFDLMPTSWFFEPGHKIRISIAGADSGNFQLNPASCPTNVVAECAETILRIHRGADTPSRIVLPVVPDTNVASISHLKSPAKN